MTYRLVLGIAGRVGRGFLDEWRSANGLPPWPRGVDILHRSDGAPIPVLHGFSRHVVPEPPDWPEGVVATGYWFLDRPADWTPPAALEEFLAAGDPPVYVGFGSMAGRDPRRVTGLVIEALRRAGLRGVLATGWGGLTPGELPPTLFQLDQAPHDWLFPRVAAVVHHGGAGTTAAGLRAGRPTVICPFFGDQPFWGRRVHELGAGAAPIPQKRLTADGLAAALRYVTRGPEVARAAGALAEKIRGEPGVANAVAAVEKLSDGRRGAAR
jgi:sterol 3beta-glucosyltransferase